jgi:F-type H+-transporting ATPase subunit delta
MSDLSTVARPYAEAVFNLAQESDSLSSWSDQLELIAALASDAQMADIVNDPRTHRDDVATLVVEICGAHLTEGGANLVRLLCRNRRLTFAPSIASQFEALRAQAESVVEAEIETAHDISEEQVKMITETLQTKLGRSVRLQTSTDPELIGGAVIRAGDWVVDGSVRAQLQKLESALRS